MRKEIQGQNTTNRPLLYIQRKNSNGILLSVDPDKKIPNDRLNGLIRRMIKDLRLVDSHLTAQTGFYIFTKVIV